KGEVLDAEAEAFLADVECTSPYEGQLVMTTINMFQANHKDAYDSDVDDGPDASIAFMAKFSSTGSPSSSNNISINKIPASTFLDLNAQITSVYKVNKERNQTLEAKTQTIDTLTTKLERYKLKVEQLDTNRVKHELEMALAERKKRSNELEEENIQLRTAIKEILKPVHPKPLVHDSEETTALSEVSRATMSKKPGHVQPINYDKLNALYSQFVPQKDLSREQVYWQSPAEVSTPTTPVKPFVKTRPASSQVRENLECIKKTFPGFEKLVKDNSVV
nr:hypothetical protein [Tanacetum cinerariifolium]